MEINLENLGDLPILPTELGKSQPPAKFEPHLKDTFVKSALLQQLAPVGDVFSPQLKPPVVSHKDFTEEVQLKEKQGNTIEFVADLKVFFKSKGLVFSPMAALFSAVGVRLFSEAPIKSLQKVLPELTAEIEAQEKLYPQAFLLNKAVVRELAKYVLPNGEAPEIQQMTTNVEFARSLFQAAGEKEISLWPKSAKLSSVVAETISLIPLKSKEEIPPKHELARSFEGAIVAGMALGRLIREGEKERGYKVKEEVLPFPIHELKVIDQVPFSLLAHWVPLNRDGEGSKKMKEVLKGVLMQLIRLMLKLIFLLFAIATASKGNNSPYLRQSAGYLGELLEEIAFSMKKVEEHYGVPFREPLAYLRVAKEALNAGDDEQFWQSLFGMIQEGRPLREFLEEFEMMEPLMKTLEGSLGSEVILPKTHFG